MNNKTWKVKTANYKDLLKLEVAFEIKEGNRKIGNISKRFKDDYFEVGTAQGTGTQRQTLEGCINWLKMLNNPILGGSNEIEIKFL